MKIFRHIAPGFAALILLFILAFVRQDDPVQDNEKGLKDYFKDHYLIGVAVPGRFLNEGRELELILSQFNSITAENHMKWMHIHPRRDHYNFTVADRMVELKEAHGLFLVGHTLVWHSQLAPWVLKPEPVGDPASDTLVVDRETLKGYIKDHISTVVGRYKGKMDGWDVVNEALNENGSLRESAFLKILGTDYIPFAFQTAGEADPEAELYYNDYNLVNPQKRDGALRIIKDLQEKGIRIDGVGIQAHWELDYPSLDAIEAAIELFSAAGVDVMFTELDISVLPSPWRMPTADISERFKNNEKMNPYTDGLPDSVETRLANRYREIFELFNKHKEKISRVTFWGLHDGVSWKNGFPIRGRTDYPLLFDRQLETKKAYEAVIQTLEN